MDSVPAPHQAAPYNPVTDGFTRDAGTIIYHWGNHPHIAQHVIRALNANGYRRHRDDLIDRHGHRVSYTAAILSLFQFEDDHRHPMQGVPGDLCATVRRGVVGSLPDWELETVWRFCMPIDLLLAA